jgi:hypothetical protein
MCKETELTGPKVVIPSNRKKDNKTTLKTVENCGACKTIILRYFLTRLNGVLTSKHRTKIEVCEKKKYRNFKRYNSFNF